VSNAGALPSKQSLRGDGWDRYPRNKGSACLCLVMVAAEAPGTFSLTTTDFPARSCIQAAGASSAAQHGPIEARMRS
jgi:hypothetical protein